MPEPLLEVRNLTVDFAAPRGPLRAVGDVSFSIGAGEVLGLVGESGSGKSVTALSILRLLPQAARIASGEVLLKAPEQREPLDLLKLSEDAMRQVRGEAISMIFQEPMTALNPVMRVGDQVAEAVRAHGQSPVSGRQSPVKKAEAWRRAIELSLGDADVERLRSIAQSRTEPASRVERARILLAYREDPSFFAVGRALGLHHQTVQRCVERAVVEGPMAALDDRPRPGKRVP